MGVFIADYTPDLSTQTINSTGGSLELGNANQRVNAGIQAVISNVSSLVGGFLLLEFQLDSGTWVGLRQTISTITIGAGTPAAIDGNTASAAVRAGGVVRNTSGVTTITGADTYTFYYEGIGRPVRIRWGASSGTATLSLESFGVTSL